MSMYNVIACVVGRGCFLWPVCFLGRSLLVFALLNFVYQGQTCLLLRVSLDFLLCIPVLCNEKDLFFGVSPRRSYSSSKNHSAPSSAWSIDLNYCDVEWFALEMNWDHSVVSEMHPGTAFWILLLTMRAITFLLRDSWPK